MLDVDYDARKNWTAIDDDLDLIEEATRGKEDGRSRFDSTNKIFRQLPTKKQKFRP